MNVFEFNYRRGLSAALIAVIVACTLWIGYMAGWGELAPLTGAPPAPRAAALEEIRLAPDFALLAPGKDLDQTTARPLFNAARRPLPGEAQARSSGSLPHGRYTLTGVSIAPDKRVALLYEAATNKTVRVEQNKELGGVLVESVTPTKVILKQGAEREVITLKIAPAPKLAAATPPAPDQNAVPARAGAPPALTLPPAAAVPPGVPRPAADVANADPITEADVAEREARVQARRSRQSAQRERAPR